MTTLRTPTALDQAAEAYVLDLAALIPTEATAWGIAGYDGELQDFSPEHYAAVTERTRRMLRDVDALAGEDDAVTAAVMRDRLGVALALHERGEQLRSLNNIASPVQEIRDSLLLMPSGDAVRQRLGKVPAAVAGYRESLRLAASRGHVSAQRQIGQLLQQLDALIDGTMLDDLLETPAPEIAQAKQAFGELAEWLRTDLAPQAPAADAVGRERYELFSHEFVGARVDLDEAYEWGPRPPHRNHCPTARMCQSTVRLRGGRCGSHRTARHGGTLHPPRRG